MSPIRLLVGVLIRSVSVLAVIAVVVLAINNSDSTDALGAGLMALLLLVPAAVGLVIGGAVHGWSGRPDAG